MGNAPDKREADVGKCNYLFSHQHDMQDKCLKACVDSNDNSSACVRVGRNVFFYTPPP